MKVALALAFALVCLVQHSTQNVLTGYGKQDDSCVGKCEAGLGDGSCQCNASCSDFGDCCSDYADVCLSCEDRCGISYDPKLECQCNSECPSHGNCCSDFNDFCEGVTSPPQGGVTDAELIEWSNLLILLDENNCGLLIGYDAQGDTTQCGSDNAPGPFFTSWDDSIWTKSTISLFRELFDNYIPAVTSEEEQTPEEVAEETAFLDAVMDSAVMTEAYNFLNTKGVFPGTKEEFRAKIYELWFEGYDRDGTSANVVGSSGFEHVFLGESKEGDVSGFHNWIHWGFEEQAGNINYYGKLDETDFGQFGGGFSNVYTWNGQEKCIGSMFLGTSPELDLAAFTVCFLTRGNGVCNLEYNGTPIYITTYDLIQNGKTHIGTAYPDWRP